MGCPPYARPFIKFFHIFLGAVAQALTIYKSLNENNKSRSFDQNVAEEISEKPLELFDLVQDPQVPSSNLSSSILSGNVVESKKKDE